MIRGGGKGWRLGAMASLALLVVVIAGASIGQSALDGAQQSGVLVSGTTDTVTNIDPAGNYDYGSFTVTNLIYQQLMGFPNGAKLQPVLATRCAKVGNARTWRCTSAQGRHVPRRLGVRLGRRQALVRPGDQDQRSVRNLVASRQPQKREDERQVRGDVQPQDAAVDLAVDPGHGGGLHRAEQLFGHPAPGEQPGADRNRAVRADAVHGRSAGGLRALRRLLGPAGEKRRAHPQDVREVLDDEARDSAR